MVQKLPKNQQEQVAVSIIKSKINAEENGSLKAYQNSTTSLSTGGSIARVLLNPKPKKEVFFFSEEKLNNFQINSSNSSRQMEKFTNFIRCCAGKNSIPKNYREHLKEKSKILGDIYKVGTYLFDTTGDEHTSENKPVIYADAEELIGKVNEERQSVGNINIKVLADGGQIFFKICLSMFPRDDCDLEEDDGKENECKRKRSTYFEGGSVANKGKLTGVQRLVILCIVPKIKETYKNIELLFRLTTFHSNLYLILKLCSRKRFTNCNFFISMPLLFYLIEKFKKLW
ncbi:unnamed protein product [Brassicogethes aeneus]|uniref:Uncharacterized protein n=1 Tax=Brassicogethes aeneus TaxID=1431903 RepID=A0A9P0FIY9_BRAAE|nr:unnamed protein product [Brassicogethes aeneus]